MTRTKDEEKKKKSSKNEKAPAPIPKMVMKKGKNTQLSGKINNDHSESSSGVYETDHYNFFNKGNNKGKDQEKKLKRKSQESTDPVPGFSGLNDVQLKKIQNTTKKAKTDNKRKDQETGVGLQTTSSTERQTKLKTSVKNNKKSKLQRQSQQLLNQTKHPTKAKQSILQHQNKIHKSINMTSYNTMIVA